MNIAWYILSFVAAIGILVTVHEFGHFWVARKLGVKVLRFSVGFGRPLWSKRSGPDQTEYMIAAIPLGGYVKMLDERDGEVDAADAHRAFNRQSLPVRTAVVLAGPVFNFIFAVFAYWLMFVIGISGAKPFIGETNVDSLARQAGMGAGQEIVEVDGKSSPTWEAVVQRVIGAALERQSVPVVVQDEAGQRFELNLDLSTVDINDLTQGQFFERIGIDPQRPKIDAVIGHLESGAPAEVAGLQTGDLVVSADGQAIGDWAHWVDIVRANPEQPLLVAIKRDGLAMQVELTPAEVESDNGSIGRIGAGVQMDSDTLSDYYTQVRYGPIESVNKAVAKTIDTTTLTLKMFWKMIQLEVSLENLSGPISIAQYAGYSAKIGPSKFIEFLAIVSISLGILNLLPIPVLDGGHLMYYLVELFIGRPVSEEAQFIGQKFGVAMLFGLMGLAFYNDLARLFG